MQTLWHDLRYSARTLIATPGFSLVVAVTLALGIGANGALFSLTDQLLLRALPVERPSELVTFANPGAFRGRQFNSNTFSHPMYRDFRDRAASLAGLVARFPVALTMTAGGTPERVSAELVSGNYFDVLGVGARVGRTLHQDDDLVALGHPLVVLSDGFWHRRFAADPTVVGRSITLNGHGMTIVGVARAGFRGIEVGQAPDLFVPLAMKAWMTPTWDDLENRRSRWLTLLGRLKPGVAVAEAETSMNVLYHQINEQELAEMTGPVPATFRERFLRNHLSVRPGARGTSQLRDDFSRPMLVLMGMVGVVLLITCANVANLLLARGAAREKDAAIRLALGASRADIVRQRLVESGLLALVGGAGGLLLAWQVGGALIAMVPQSGAEIGLSGVPDGRVLAFVAAVSLVTAAVFGAVPAFQATRPELVTTLKNEAGSVAGTRVHARARQGLVIVQVALSAILLTGAGLFAGSLYNLKALDPGFQTEHLLTFTVEPVLNGYDSPRAIALIERLQQELDALPMVTGVSVGDNALLTNSVNMSTVRVAGYVPKDSEDMNPRVAGVGSAYFATLGIPVLLGREFTTKDGATAPKVAVVNETFAKYFFGTGNPIGRRFGFRRDDDSSIEIVGVARDTLNDSLRDGAIRYVYVPFTQSPEITQLSLYVRARGEPLSAAGAARDALHRIDANLPVFGMKSMPAQLDESLFAERMVAMLALVFGGLATLLAAVGLYGLLSYSVTRRTREIGIRMALGADASRVRWLVLHEVLLLVAAGVVVGLPLALGLARTVQAQLFALRASDPRTMAAAVAVLAAVAIVASYLPVRRATTVSPMLALRYD